MRAGESLTVAAGLNPTRDRLSVTSVSGYLSMGFEDKYSVASKSFPPWLLSHPIAFPRDHRTFGWACAVPRCDAVLSETTTRRLCVSHEREYRPLRDHVDLESFLNAAKPLASQHYGWALTRDPHCLICGPGRESYRGDYCYAHDHSLYRARRQRGISEATWRAAQSPHPALRGCSVTGCVHDGRVYGDQTMRETFICRNHWNDFHRYLKKAETTADNTSWSVWLEGALRGKALQVPDARGLVMIAHLKPRLQCEVRYAIHRYSTSPRRSQWRPQYLQVVLDQLADAGVASLNDPVVDELARRSSSVQYSRRIWIDLPRAARSLTVTKGDLKAAGLFDPIIVGASAFPSSQGSGDRRVPWNLTGVSQRWLRDLLWDHLEFVALQPTGKQVGAGSVAIRILGVRMLSKALRHMRVDQGDDPVLLTLDDAKAFKELWDLWFKEQTPVVERRNSPPGSNLAPITQVSCMTFTNTARTVLTWGRRHDKIGPEMDSFIFAFPSYSRAGRSRPMPRPISDEDFKTLVSADALQLLDEADTADVGFSDIWLTHALQGGRISETLRLRLGCVGLIGAAQPYIWRDISKVNVIDFGLPCYLPVYERLLRRQEITRSQLKERYAHDLSRLDKRQRTKLEGDWERTIPLFPSKVANPDLHIEYSQSYFIDVFNNWIEKLGLKGITTHRTRATLATALLNNGAPPALVRQMLGHFSEDALAHYARYNDRHVARHLQQLWAAGPGMQSPGKILLTPQIEHDPTAAALARIDLTIVPVEHGLCRYGPVVGGNACPRSKNCTTGPSGPCEHFILTGADLAYWERKRDAAYHFAEGAPSDEARDYILDEWKSWELVLSNLRQALEEMGLLEAAENLDLRSPRQDYFQPLFTTGWQIGALEGTRTSTYDDEDDDDDDDEMEAEGH